MEAVECLYRGRVIGWLIGDRYLSHVIKFGKGRGIKRQWPDGGYRIEKPDGHIVMIVSGSSEAFSVPRDHLGRPRMTFGELLFWLSLSASIILFMIFVFPRLMGHD